MAFRWSGNYGSLTDNCFLQWLDRIDSCCNESDWRMSMCSYSCRFLANLDLELSPE